MRHRKIARPFQIMNLKFKIGDSVCVHRISRMEYVKPVGARRFYRTPIKEEFKTPIRMTVCGACRKYRGWYDKGYRSGDYFDEPGPPSLSITSSVWFYQCRIKMFGSLFLVSENDMQKLIEKT